MLLLIFFQDLLEKLDCNVVDYDENMLQGFLPKGINED